MQFAGEAMHQYITAIADANYDNLFIRKRCAFVTDIFITACLQYKTLSVLFIPDQYSKHKIDGSAVCTVLGFLRIFMRNVYKI